MLFLLVFQYLTDLGDRYIDRIVDDFVLISMQVTHLSQRRFQTGTDRLFALGLPIPQAMFEFFHRRQDE